MIKKHVLKIIGVVIAALFLFNTELNVEAETHVEVNDLNKESIKTGEVEPNAPTKIWVDDIILLIGTPVRYTQVVTNEWRYGNEYEGTVSLVGAVGTAYGLYEGYLYLVNDHGGYYPLEEAEK